MLLCRLVALLSSVTMLHLTVGAADAACAGNGLKGHAAAGHAAAAGHLVHEHHAEPLTSGMLAPMSGHAAHLDVVAATRISGSTGGSPAQSRCCESMTSCSVTGNVAQRVAVVATLPAASVALTARTDGASSAPRAPEPPPPKA